jgi:hypothetical protein
MSTIAQPECKIQVIFVAFNRFGNTHTTCRNRADDGHSCNRRRIKLENYEILCGRAIVLEQEDIDI